MKFFLDLFPAIAFFVAYKISGIYVATSVLIASMFALVLIYWLWKRELHKMHLITAIIVAIFGGMTLYIHDPAFIKFKPTALYTAFSIALLLSHVIGEKVLLQRIPQTALKIPDVIWRRINFAWAIFFAFCALLNLYVAANYDEDTWVKFKTFGFSVLMLIFMFAHIPFIARYLPQEK